MHIWGACGVGKSQIVSKVADTLECEFLDIRVVLLDPVDLLGLPRIVSDSTDWVSPRFLPASGKGILFRDELTFAPQMTQAGCRQLMLDRKLGEYRLPGGWAVLAADNPASEPGVHFSMPRPLRNRFIHLDLEPDLADRCNWAVHSGLPPEIIAFLRFKPGLLHDGDATSDPNAWPTPRAWEMASNVLKGLVKRTSTSGGEIEAQILERTFGPAATADSLDSCASSGKLPSIDEIVLSPDTAPLPYDPWCQIAIATALGRAMSDDSVAKGAKHLNLMPTEMWVLPMRDAAARDRAITDTPGFIRFGVEHGEVLQ